MKKVFVLLAAATIAVTTHAGTTCRKDFMGNTVCTDDSGYSTTQRQDFMGNTRIEDNRGNSITCRKDFMGNVRCE